MARTALLNVMVQAVLKAGRGLTRDFGEVENLQVSLKGPGDFVSAADRRADETLIAELRKARPAYGFLTEESGVIAGSDDSHRWIIDPLDGTTNFLHGIPLFAVSLALEREGQLVAGVIYNPILNELYVAEKGAGAFLNDRRLRVAARRNLADCVIATGLPGIGRGTHGIAIPEINRMMPRLAGLRRSGSAATDLAWVASGRSTATGRTASARGISRPGSCSSAKPAARSATPRARPRCSPPVRWSPATRRFTPPCSTISWLPARVPEAVFSRSAAILPFL